MRGVALPPPVRPAPPEWLTPDITNHGVVLKAFLQKLNYSQLRFWRFLFKQPQNDPIFVSHIMRGSFLVAKR